MAQKAERVIPSFSGQITDTLKPKNPIRDPYNADELRQSLAAFGYALSFSNETASTMDDARKVGIKPTVILTDHQTQGRGRTGRSWLDEPGMSVLMTIVEPFNEIDGDPRGNSFLPHQMFTLAACVALQEITGNPNVRIKWPNDLVYAGANQTNFGRKIGGVLVENPDYTSEGTYPKLIGVGINIHYPSAQDSFPKTDYGAISLSEVMHGKNLHRQNIVTAIIREWSKARVALRGLSIPATLKKYTDLWNQNAIALTGKKIRISGVNNDPDKSIEGVVIKFPFRKALTLDTENGKQEFTEFSPNTRVEIIS